MRTIIIAGLGLLSASPALAQSTFTTGGPRIELRAGWDDAVPTLTYDDGVTRRSASEGKSGVSYGGEIGYDRVVSGSAFLGAYAGIDGATTKQCFAIDVGTGCLRAGRNLTVGLRTGYVVGVNSMVYLKGGYSNGQLRFDYRDPTAATNNLNLSDNLSGFHAGVGGEVGIGKMAYGKLEYVYTHYTGYKFTDGVDTASANLNRHQIVLGLGVRL